MKVLFCVVAGALLVLAPCEPARTAEGNLYAEGKIVLMVPEAPEPLEEFAIAELTEHIRQVTGSSPERTHGDVVTTGNCMIIGQVRTSPVLRTLAQESFFETEQGQQGYSLKIDRNPCDERGRSWLAALCGADPQGVLYAVRDFSHYHFYQDNSRVVLKPATARLAPRLKLRGLSESGCNFFSAKNPHEDFMHTVKFNYFSEDVVFDKQYYVDWLSEWKINFISLLWCNSPAYDEARRELVQYAHARGIQVLGFYVPYRPSHEKPPASISNVEPMLEHGDCPRDPKVRQWYFDRLTQLVTQEPKPDMIQIESPYHDGVYCQCPVCQGTKNPYPEDRLLEEMVAVVRQHRPDIPIVRGMNRPVPDEAAARRLAQQLKKLEGPNDWHINTCRDREHARRWHDLGPKFAGYLRLYRTALKGTDAVSEINFLFDVFHTSAERDIVAHQFCYRFYGGRFGSFPVESDNQMRERYPDRKGPFSLALAAEAAFDPFVEGPARAEKVRRIHALSIPDYPPGRLLTDKDLESLARHPKPPALSEPTTEDPAAHPPQSKLFRYQWGIKEPGFLMGQICADLDNDGRREIFYSSRGTKRTSLLNSADGKPQWTVTIPGDHQSACAYDLDGDGTYEIIYTTAAPGRIHVLDAGTGKTVAQWETDDSKLGNSPVIFDGDGDGVFDGYFGSRNKYLLRMNMRNLVPIQMRTGWSQCGCHTSAMDVDGDGRWDLFAGSGDDQRRNGTLHRLDPETLETVWSYATDDNASSADPVLADIDGDGKVEIIKSVDNYAGDDAHDAVFAFRTDGTLLWKTEGFSGEDSPNVADLNGDGKVEIVGMTFGGEVYCLDYQGRIRWRKDLRPELDNSAHAYMTPILCDLNGDKHLEILAMTNGGYFDAESAQGANAVVVALSANGDVIDRFDLGSPRFWGFAFVSNVDDDPYLELIACGSGGLDVIETRGYGPATEHFQRRRSYQRLNVLPWAYEDSYFIYRGDKAQVENLADSLVLAKRIEGYRSSGKFTTELFSLPPACQFTSIEYAAGVPESTQLRVNIVGQSGRAVAGNVANGTSLKLSEPVRLEFVFGTANPAVSPRLNSYRLSFDVMN
ncbi:MAG: hypothetical protein GXY83_02730 [Rhodopirellula sp.]|nr:hypothetical protein [Rhodopirellula sp.]